jgi:hypothetical protein
MPWQCIKNAIKYGQLLKTGLNIPQQRSLTKSIISEIFAGAFD